MGDFHAWNRRFDIYEPPPLSKKKRKPELLPEEVKNNQELQAQEEVQNKLEEQSKRKRTREFLPRAAKMAITDPHDGNEGEKFEWPDHSRRRRPKKGPETEQNKTDAGKNMGEIARKRNREIDER